MVTHMKKTLTMAGAIVLACCQARAASQYFDVDPGTAPIDGGAGNWSDSLWKTAPDGTTSNAWVSGSEAVFGPIIGTPDTTVVTLSGTVSATGGVTFNGAGYTLTGGTLDIGSSWFNMAQPATISSALTRLQVTNNAELAISGGGTLTGRAIIGSAGSDSRVRQTGGDITVSGEWMMIGGNNSANAKGQYILESGTLTVDKGIYFGWGFGTSYGTFTQNGGTVETKDNGQGLQLGIGGGHGTYNLNAGILLSTFGAYGDPYTYQTFVFGGGLFRARASTAAQSGMAMSIATGKSALLDTQSYTVTLPCAITGPSAEGLTKGGSGTLVLSGANTYAGVTLITNGTLRVSNTSGSGTGSSSVSITNGAALDGSGTLAGVVTVSADASISGGADGSGTLTLDQTPVFAPGAKLRLVPNAAKTSYGRLHSKGNLDLSSLTIELASLPQVVVGTYTIASCDGTLSGSFSVTNLPPTCVLNVDPVGKTVQLTRSALYVSNTGNDGNDGLSWATAKATIQAGVDSVGVNGTVLVSNGVYSSGSYVTPGSTLNNRVVITNNVIVRSLVPYGAVIQGPGASAYNTGSALRCVYMSDGVLDGFVIEGGATAGGAFTWNGVGGGLAISSATAYATNCIIRNSKAYAAGGAYYGVLRDCIISNNVVESSGGGIHSSTLYNCLVSNNASREGGGVSGVTAYDCMIVSNTATGGDGGGSYNSNLYRCKILSNTQASGSGNAGGMCSGSAYSSLFAYNTANSVGGTWKVNLYGCTVVSNKTTGAGPGIHYAGIGENIYNTLAFYNTGGTGKDIANLSSGSTVSNTLAGSSSMALPGITLVSAGTPVFADPAQGDYRLCDDSPAINAGNTALNPVLNTQDLARNLRACFGTVDAGAYEFYMQYVSPTGNDANSGYSWTTAKQTIQGGVNAATPGVVVLVTNGTYSSGTYPTPVSGSTSNRVVITNAVTVKSVNGPSVTTIQGGGTYNVAGATRCVFMNSGVLDGFTLENGATMSDGTAEYGRGGGGVCIMNAAAGTTVKNCVIRNNRAYTGGGVTGGQAGSFTDYAYKNNATVTGCVITNNTAAYGGGMAYYSVFSRCVIAGNTATTQGGGGYAADNGLHHSLVARNMAPTGAGGGIFMGALNNCTIADNTNGGVHGSSNGAILRNCILFGNSAWQVAGTYTLTNSTTSDPSFRDAVNNDYRLKADSPCLNAGDNAWVVGTQDLDGKARISFGTVDIGAFELPEYLRVTFDVAPGVYVATATNTLTVLVPSTNGVYGSYLPTDAVYRKTYEVVNWTSGPDGTGSAVSSETSLLSLEDHTVYVRWRHPGTVISFL